MPPKNPIDAESGTEAHQAELEKPFSSKTTKDRKGSKKSKYEEESAHESHERILTARRDSSSLPKTRWVEEGTSTTAPTTVEGTAKDNSSGRERLKRHRVEVAGRVWIPEIWGQEALLKDWIDCTAFDAALVHSSIVSARASLVEEGRRANCSRFRIENSCS